MCSDEDAAVSVLLEMKQIDRVTFTAKVSASLDLKQAEEPPLMAASTSLSFQEVLPLHERKHQKHSGKRRRLKDCSVGSKALKLRRQSLENVNDAKHNDAKLPQVLPLVSPISVTSNLPLFSTAPSLPIPSLSLKGFLPSTFDTLVNEPAVVPNANLLVGKSATTFPQHVAATSAVANVPSADVSLQLLQQMFSLVNLISPQELASTLLMAELNKMKAQMVTQQQSDFNNFMTFLPLLMPLLQQQLQAIATPACPPPPPKIDGMENNATMAWMTSLLLQTCLNASS